MPDRFDVATIEKLGHVREVQIETTAVGGAAVHRATIWVVVVGDQAFVRSEYAEKGRWYREARAQPEVILHAEGQEIPVTAVLASDSDIVTQVSNAFRAKYGKGSPASAEAMVAAHTLEHTLRLDPRVIEPSRSRADLVVRW